MKYVSKKAYGGVPSGAPHEADFGYDLYGTQDDIDQLEDDFGTTDDGSNGHAQGLLTTGEDIYNSNAWDTCICTQNSNGECISTVRTSKPLMGPSWSVDKS